MKKKIVFQGENSDKCVFSIKRKQKSKRKTENWMFIKIKNEQKKKNTMARLFIITHYYFLGLYSLYFVRPKRRGDVTGEGVY